jgi:hypothetical protein
MTDKPKTITAVPIQVGQVWLTRSEATVRILADNAEGDFPFVGQFDTHEPSLWNAAGVQGVSDKEGDMVPCPDGFDNLSHLAPQTVKHQVALYRENTGFGPIDYLLDTSNPLTGEYRQISEPVTIEFTLLPGESADA